MLRRYTGAARRLLLLDYDGTLTPFSAHPSMALPENAMLDILTRIAAHAKNDVYIISGRDSAILEEWFGGLPIGLIAEHGAKIRHRNGRWETDEAVLQKDWKTEVKELMEQSALQCPQSFIEEKEYSLAWHYRNADAGTSIAEGRKLYEKLLAFTTRLPLHILDGKKVLEVRLQGISKGTAAAKILHHAPYDFILSAGDDITDEDMFQQLANLPQAVTIKIGGDVSIAQYHLRSPAGMQALLQAMLDAEQEPEQ